MYLASAFLLTLAGSTVALPTRTQPTGQKVDGKAIHLKARHRYNPASAPKYSGLVKANAATSTTSFETPSCTDYPGSEIVPLYSSIGGLEYEVEVEVGGTTLTVLADTGSGDFWIPSSDCPNCEKAGMVASNFPGAPADASNCTTLYYGSGSVDVCGALANVTLGDRTLSQFPIFTANNISDGVMQSGSYFSGIMGLSNGAARSGRTFPQALYDAGQISSLTLGLYLSKNDTEGSEFTLGDPKLSKHIDTTKHVALKAADSSGAYDVNVTGILVNGKSISGPLTSVLVDSGTSSIVLPTQAATDLIAAVYGDAAQASGTSWFVPCEFAVPSHAFNFGGVHFAMDPRDWVLPQINNPGDGMCLSSFQSNDDITILGNPFLRSVYSVFHLDSHDVDFYALK